MLQTDDLFLGALGLLRGGELRAVEVRSTHGRRVAVFLIDGADDVERDYYRGPSLVDLRLFKSEVARLKSIAFEALRKEESRGAHQHQPGPDRGHQVAGGSRGHRR